MTIIPDMRKIRATRPWYQAVRGATQIGFVALAVLGVARVGFWFLVVLLGLALLGGAWFCGWLCPLGSAQEWVGRIGKRLFGRRLRLPPAVERPAAWLRFLLLGLSIAGVGAVGFLSQPYQSFSGLLAGNTATVTVFSWILLGLLLALSLFVDRPFCRYFCVEGAQYGAAGILRLFTIRRDPSACSGCQACDRACPTQVPVSVRTHVRSRQCINCFECISACPSRGALRFGFFRRKEVPK